MDWENFYKEAASKYQLIYADPPWPYEAFHTSNPGNHYSLMSWKDIHEMPVMDIAAPDAACFLWASGPFMDKQIETLKKWGFHYRGITFVWVKTKKDGVTIIGAQGPKPTFVKPRAEFLLVGTTCKEGRPFPIQTMKMNQYVLAPVEQHSKKPDIFRKNLDELCGDIRKIELFARFKWEGWHQSGLEFNGLDYRNGDLVGTQ